MARSLVSVRNATCVAIGDRGVLIEGPPGSGKSALALALIDRGAQLVGDDGVTLAVEDTRLVARPHPRTRGLLEIRNLGLARLDVRDEVDVALMVTFDPAAPRFIETALEVMLDGIAIPHIAIWPEPCPPAIKVEQAMRLYGLPAQTASECKG